MNPGHPKQIFISLIKSLDSQIQLVYAYFKVNIQLKSVKTNF